MVFVRKKEQHKLFVSPSQNENLVKLTEIFVIENIRTI